MTDTMVFSLVIMSVLIIVLGVLRLRHASLQGLVLGLIGAILGLLLGALASVPLSKLPHPWGSIMPVLVSVGFTLILMAAVLSRRHVLLGQLSFLRLESKPADSPAPAAPSEPMLPQILVDTSVIIDGRIADIASAGFVPGRLAVPRFVLAELQNIADSDDAMRRGRGRRGLDVLNRLREMPDLEVAIIEDDVPSIREVDAKLVALAQKFKCNVLTTDYNLNRVAQIQGVRVLNVNELSNAIRPVVLPGEELIVRVVQPGKERNQGVGYLADGTMIVVENGDKLIGQEVPTEVTRVFQTVAGKMIFAVPRSAVGAPAAAMPAVPAPVPGTDVPPRTPAPVTTDEPPRSTDRSDKPDSDANNRKRFGRGRKRGNQGGHSSNGASHQASAQSEATRHHDIESRIIAATNATHKTPSDNRQS